MQEQDYIEEWNHHAKLEPVIPDLVQDHVPAERDQEGFFQQRDPEAARPEAIRASVGHGPKAEKGHGQAQRQVHPGGHDRDGRRVFYSRVRCH